ncbi:hypothetical protein ACIREO_23085 [Streptomyces sp. NPDC102441]|uniref:hypothetical protein n=1 Tax=Streptomyces sp. NPDC102441 TaxID=3366176 RepID=UPI00381C53C2
MPQAEVDTPVDDAALEPRRAAGRELQTAFRDSGVHAKPQIGTTTAASAVSVTIPLEGGGAAQFLIGKPLPLADPAAPLQYLLKQHEIQAKVTIVEFGPDPVLKVALATCDDARRLAALVIERRSEAHDAALRLRTVFTKIGVTENHIYVTDGTVEIGDIDVRDAVTLYDILAGGGSSAEAHGLHGLNLHDRWDSRGWRDVEKLAQLLGPIVSKASGQYLESLPNPACHDCISSRPHRITLGSAHPRQVLLFADAITSADGAASSTDPGPPDR